MMLFAKDIASMFFVTITTLACAFLLSHLSKILAVHLAESSQSGCIGEADIRSEKVSDYVSFKTSWIHRLLTISKTSIADSKHRLRTKLWQPGQAVTFFHLPPEIRLEIYDVALPKQHPYIIGRDYGHDTSALKYSGLLQTNRQMRFETLPVFFGGNTFIIDIHELKDLKAFLKWVLVLNDEITGSVQDLRITVAGALLVDIVWLEGRRRYVPSLFISYLFLLVLDPKRMYLSYTSLWVKSS